MESRLDAHLSFDPVDSAGGASTAKKITPAASSAHRPIGLGRITKSSCGNKQTPVGYAALKRLGISAGMVESRYDGGDGDPGAEPLRPLLDDDLPNAPAAHAVIHFDVVDRDGNAAVAYSGNLLLGGGAGLTLLPLAASGKPGVWNCAPLTC